MGTQDQRADIILQHEKQFAEALARQVIQKPEISVWMILIPVLFVYHMYRLPRYAQGKKEFVENYLLSRISALHEASSALAEGRQPDTGSLAVRDDVPADIQPHLREILDILVQHYTSLLQAAGDDFPSLARSAYGSGTAYLLIMRRLNDAEGKLYAALTSRLQQEQDDVGSAVSHIGVSAERLRREEAGSIFGASPVS